MLIYTSYSEGYDLPREDILVVPPSTLFISGRLNAKVNKVLPHLIFTDEVTIWCDANIFLSQDNLRDIEIQLNSYDIVVMTHPTEDVYAEAEACKLMQLDSSERINKQVEFYKSKRFDKKGLYACGVIARRHTPKINSLCEQWWSHVTMFSSRDQISFPYIFKDINVGTIDYCSVRIEPHLKKKL